MNNVTIFVLIMGAILCRYSVFVLPDYFRGVVFNLGRYRRVVGPGLVAIIPFVETLRRVDLRTMAMVLDPEEVTTLDRRCHRVSATVGFRAEDPAKVATSVHQPFPSHRRKDATSLHYYLSNVRTTAQQTLKKLAAIPDLSDDKASWTRLEQRMRDQIQETVEPWGVKIESVKVEVLGEVKRS